MNRDRVGLYIEPPLYLLSFFAKVYALNISSLSDLAPNGGLYGIHKSSVSPKTLRT